jgi:hypothetical protein
MELADCLVPHDQDLDYGDVVFGSGLRHVPGRVASHAKAILKRT